MQVSGDNDAELDFNAVQRGDAEMAQKLYRVVRTCVEMGANNPIVSIHDQGAGGNCNVVKEIIYPKGAEIDIRSIVVGDKTMSVLEIWGAEYQEQDALLIRPQSEDLLRSVCERERVSMAIIGKISGEGKVVLVDSTARQEAIQSGLPEPRPAVDLDLEKVLGDMPRKKYHFTRKLVQEEPLDVAPGSTVSDALYRVLHLPSICSKRFLTTKVRSLYDS
jgi:phosphoribosylformylglycinamidine synthase